MSCRGGRAIGGYSWGLECRRFGCALGSTAPAILQPRSVIVLGIAPLEAERRERSDAGRRIWSVTPARLSGARRSWMHAFSSGSDIRLFIRAVVAPPSTRSARAR
jgi:hypothetical protein